jgi:hypothetical protein
MNTRREHYEEPERPEGERVRGDLDSEDRGEVQTGYPGHPEPARPAAAADRKPVAPDRAPGAPHAGAPDYAEQPATVASDDTRDGGAEQVGLLNDVAGLREEWQRVQGTFVDDPSRAVHEASVLVDRTLDEIRVNVGSGHTSETTSTEDLRVSFQRYREFFERLLSA